MLDAEERLRLAMMASDVAVLNDLLADELLFTNHLGHLLSKHADLAAHEQRLLTITDLRASERHVRINGNVAVVSVRMQLTGSYHDVETHGDFRFYARLGTGCGRRAASDRRPFRRRGLRSII